jgi:transcriptional regulator with XRE-family HTH domain
MPQPLEVDYKATLLKWTTAIATYRLNISEVARMSGVTRQHITNILNGTAVPSMLVAERIDKAIDASVDERHKVARLAITAGSQGGESNEQ